MPVHTQPVTFTQSSHTFSKVNQLLQTTVQDGPSLSSLVAARVNQAISVAVQRVVAFNILEYRYTSLPKGRVAVHAQAEPGGADWDDDEPEAQQEPVEGAAPGGGEGPGQVAALSEGAAEGDYDVPLVGGH